MKFIAGAWRPRATALFGIDLRSLALFRVAIASLLAWYALQRLPDASAFLTDWGVLPRSFAVEADAWGRFSLYFMNGEYWFAALLLLSLFLAAVALWFGYRTRLATVAAFVLFTSLVTRNPIILIGGDSLLCCLLFWAMFLPLGARWSVDAALSTTPPPSHNQHVSAASTGLILQVLSVYFFSALLKRAPDWWPDGTAVYYTMELERYASPLGRDGLRQFPAVMQGLSYFVYFLELLGPLIALSPWLTRPLRFVIMLALMGMHVGFIVFMEIGYFPFVSLSALTVLLGGWFWDWRARVNERAHPVGPKIYYDRDCGFCLKSCVLFRTFLVLPRAVIAPAQDSQRAKALLEANNSWVVIDEHDVAHLKWDAFVALLRPSPLFGWLFHLLRWPFWGRVGTPVYDFVARHRGRFGAVTARLLPERSVRFEVGRRAQVMVAIFVATTLVWNLHTIKALPSEAILAPTPVFRLVRLDQIWNMFAPFPSRLDGWVVFPGRLEDGTEVDVLRPGAPLSWERPRYLGKVHENIAWHTYRWRILERQFHGHFLYYGRYLCREWNWRASPGKRLLTFDMAYLQEITPPPGQPSKVERVTAWHHDCRPQQFEQRQRDEQERRRDPMEHERSRPV